MQDANKIKISEAEMRKLLIKNLNNRPNAMATYGQAKMSSAEAKDVFDKQFQLIASKFNELCDLISELNSTYATDKELEDGVKSAKGVSGVATLNAEGFKNTEIDGKNMLLCTVEMCDVGDNDVILFSPSTIKDKDTMVDIGLFAEPGNLKNDNGSTTVTFYADKAPERDISMSYFVSRGQEEV